MDTGGNCIAVISDADIAAAAQRRELALKTAREIGRPPPFIEPQLPVTTAVQLMHRWATTHLVVVEPRTSHPVGVLSILDIVDQL